MRRLTLLVILVGVASMTLACGSAGGGAPSGPTITYPTSSEPPPVADSPAVAATRAEIVRALGEHNLVLQDPQTAFRPAEGPALAGSPRAIYQVILPDEPGGGYIVVYELRDVPSAAAAGADQAAYLASGPGRVQTPIGTRHILRQLGSTLVLYSWNPDGATDERTPDIQDALETLGTPIVIPG
jgi:hypothetical protein